MKNWRAIVGAVLIFVLGMSAGALITVKICQRWIGKIKAGGPRIVAELIERRLATRLSLDNAQRRQLRTIVQKAYGEIQDAQRQIQPQVRETLERAETSVRAILRPDQVKKFDKLVAERKSTWGGVQEKIP